MKGETFAHCRVLGHTWRPVTVTTEGSNFVQVLRCTICKTERRWKLSATGQPIGNSYTYGEGYQEKEGLTPHDKDALRLRWVRARARKNR